MKESLTCDIGSVSWTTEARNCHSKCITSDLLNAQKETDGVKGCSISIHKVFINWN